MAYRNATAETGKIHGYRIPGYDILTIYGRLGYGVQNSYRIPECGDSIVTEFLNVAYRIVTEFLNVAYRIATEFLNVAYSIVTEFLNVAYRIVTEFLNVAYSIVTEFLNVA